jgi:hypothetical protein
VGKNSKIDENNKYVQEFIQQKDPQNDLLYINNLKELQKKFLNLEENQYNPNITKIMPRKSSNIQIIENNQDFDTVKFYINKMKIEIFRRLYT